MKTYARAIIGAAYGDEGKGLLTDYFAAQSGTETLTVRFNSGAQAGHTVVTPDGKRHVFSHFGSGSFVGARTYLSRFFVANPMLFFKELAVLKRHGVADETLTPFLDERAAITTPYDTLINQIIETARGAERHGSCGIGFGETIERNLHPEFALVAADLLLDPATLRKRLFKLLIDISERWVPARLAQLNVPRPQAGSPLAALFAVLVDPDLIERWIDDAQVFVEAVTLSRGDPMRTAAARGALLFEGAQGLLLDQDRGAFPYVTRSNTGLRNVLAIADEIGLSRLDAIYATRAYATRHGAGPLAHEAQRPYAHIEDQTNIPNDFQGTLRFGHIEPALLSRTIADDLSDAASRPGLLVTPSLAVTCLDQVDSEISIVEDGRQATVGESEFLGRLIDLIKPAKTFVAHGPTRSAVTSYAAGTRAQPLSIGKGSSRLPTSGGPKWLYAPEAKRTLPRHERCCSALRGVVYRPPVVRWDTDVLTVASAITSNPGVRRGPATLDVSSNSSRRASNQSYSSPSAELGQELFRQSLFQGERSCPRLCFMRRPRLCYGRVDLTFVDRSLRSRGPTALALTADAYHPKSDGHWRSDRDQCEGHRMATSVALRAGPLTAGADSFDLVIEGRGGHGAAPHLWSR